MISTQLDTESALDRAINKQSHCRPRAQMIDVSGQGTRAARNIKSNSTCDWRLLSSKVLPQFFLLHIACPDSYTPADPLFKSLLP